MPDGTLVCYQHGDIVLIRDKKIIKRYIIISNKKERILGRFKLAYRLFRMGVRAAEAINSNKIVLSIGNMLYELNIENGDLSSGYFCGEGARVLSFSRVENIPGLQDGIYYGTYFGRLDKKPVHLYRRIGVDKWEIKYTFPLGSVDHVHTIVPDSYRHCLWVFTGDFGEASAIWKVEDNFNKVERLVCNNQKYRACVAFALKEGLLYATDSPFEDDSIYLLDPDINHLKEIMPIHGSCIYGCRWRDRFIFSSTVEPDNRAASRVQFYFGRKRGAGIKDDYVHMYCGNLKDGFEEIYKEKKDGMPYSTFMFGAFKFPSGYNNGNSLFFQPIATKKNDLNLMSFTDN